MERGTLNLTERLIAEAVRITRAALARRYPSLSFPQRQDVEQEVLLKLCRMARDGKNLEYPGSYLWKVVATTALDLLEAEQGTASLEECLEKAGPRALPGALISASGEGAVESRRRMESLLAGLPERRRIVVKLHLDGWDIDRSAAWLGWSKATVRHLLYRGLAQLRKAEKSEDEDHEGGRAGLSIGGGVREGLPD
jgi:RNA polymerase sigma factor (sigma-70 family)